MALRPPSRYQSSAIGASSASGVLNTLDHEILGEKAAALGRAGEKVQSALGRLGAEPADSPRREKLVKQAADAVYVYFIQRELCGLRRHHDVIREYSIPAEVLLRLGAS